MRRLLPFLMLFVLSPGLRLPAQQQLSDEEKRRIFLKAREEMKAIPLPPQPGDDAPAPRPRPKPPVTPNTNPTPPRPTPNPFVLPEPTPAPGLRPFNPQPGATPLPPRPQPTPFTSTPPPRPQPTPFPNAPTGAPIHVVESGVMEADREEEPPPKKEGFWSRLFGGGSVSYKYLTPTIRKAIDGANVTRGRWRNLVVHNSGTRQGNAKAFEYYHLNVRKMPNGLAYHFVIGNGTSSGDGQIEIGNRWRRQIQGGHVHSDYLNNISIGICLVGDFNNSRPTARQLESLEELLKYLRKRVGKVGGQSAVVWPHRRINPPQWPTDCPGDKFPYDWLRSRF